MYISVVTLYVDDLDRAIDFYTSKLGWEKTMDEPMGEDRWVTVAPGNDATQTALTLMKGDPGWQEWREKIGGMSGVIMEVDDVYETYDQLTKRGVEFAQNPSSEPWGGWAMFKDSEGNVHGLHSPARATVSSN
jgi:predicted enzyme related to lactoylglutathione lyase